MRKIYQGQVARFTESSAQVVSGELTAIKLTIFIQSLALLHPARFRLGPFLPTLATSMIPATSKTTSGAGKTAAASKHGVKSNCLALEIGPYPSGELQRGY